MKVRWGYEGMRSPFQLQHQTVESNVFFLLLLHWTIFLFDFYPLVFSFLSFFFFFFFSTLFLPFHAFWAVPAAVRDIIAGGSSRSGKKRRRLLGFSLSLLGWRNIRGGASRTLYMDHMGTKSSGWAGRSIDSGFALAPLAPSRPK